MTTREEALYLKGWTWFLRFSVAGRRLEHYRRRMWDLVRVRIRDILYTPWPPGTFAYLTPPDQINDPVTGLPRRVVLGDVYRSELAVAILLQWHIYKPRHVVDGHVASNRLVQAKALASLPANWNPTTDTPASNHEADLIAGLLLYINNHLGSTELNTTRIPKVVQWPFYQGRPSLQFRLTVAQVQPLSHDFKSFKFDDTDLPPPPPAVGTSVQAFALQVHKPECVAAVHDHADHHACESSVGLFLVSTTPPVPSDDDPQTTFRPDHALFCAAGQDGDDNVFHGFLVPIAEPFTLSANSGSVSDCFVHPSPGMPAVRAESLRIADLAELPRRIRLSPGGFLADAGLDLVFGDDLALDGDGNVTGPMNAVLTMPAAVWPSDRPLSLALAGDTANTAALRRVVKPADADELRLPLEAASDLFASLGLPVVPAGGADVGGLFTFAFDGNWRVTPRFAFTLGRGLTTDLGSALAQLRLEFGDADRAKLHFDGTAVRLDLTPVTQLAARVQFDLFDELAGEERVSNNSWNERQHDGTGGRLLAVRRPIPSDGLDRAFVWSGTGVAAATDLFRRLFSMDGGRPEIIVNEDRLMTSLAGKVIGAAEKYLTRFKPPADLPFRFEVRDGEAFVDVPVKLAVAGPDADGADPLLFQAEGHVRLSLGRGDAAAVDIAARSCRCLPESLLWTDAGGPGRETVSRFGPVMSMHVPHHTALRFSTDPNKPFVRWDEAATKAGPGLAPGDGTEAKVLICVPARKTRGADDEDGNDPAPEMGRTRFTYEVEEFFLHSSGIDLSGSVRPDSVALGDEDRTGFAEPLAVKPRARSPDASEEQQKVGSIRCKNSVLTHASLETSAKLKYFSNATGTFTLAVTEYERADGVAGNGTLSVAGQLRISQMATFSVPDLNMNWRVKSLTLATEFRPGGGGRFSWHSSGSMSGQIAFEPIGRSADDGAVALLKDLYRGLTVDFENVNPVDLGSAEFAVHFPPLSFELAKVLKVDMKGIGFRRGKNAAKDLQLLGDVSLRNLPGVDASLTFGGVRVRSGPSVTAETVAAKLTFGSGLSAEGSFSQIDRPGERGFEGSIGIPEGALPALDGRIKLVQIATKAADDEVPAMALSLGAGLDQPLFAGFFLRRLAAGMGVYQALRGLERHDLPLQQRINRFVDDPRGLPQPGADGAWVLTEPAARQAAADVNWMLVANGLITYGKLPPDKEHPFTCDITLALDHRFDLVAGVNAWLFTSPNQAREAGFLDRPAARGAVALSPRERTIYGYFRTLKEPRMGDNAPPLLKSALNGAETTLRFLADPNGFLVEVGWPWETRFGYALPPFGNLAVLAGFRYGFYRGVISFGLNLAVRLQLGGEAKVPFGTRLGRAEAVLRGSADVDFRTSFAGAVTPAFEAYLLGDVRFSAALRLEASANCSLSKKICGIKVRLKIGFSKAFRLPFSAAASAALTPGGVGVTADVPAAVSVCGYRLGGRVPVRISDGRIGDARTTIQQLLPPGLAAATPFAAPAGIAMRSFAALSAAAPAAVSEWNYRFTRRGGFVRVLLFPAPGAEYPKPARLSRDRAAQAPPRFRVRFRSPAAFRGFLGDRFAPAHDGTLEWSEELDRTIYPFDTLFSDPNLVEPEDRDQLAQLGEHRDLRLADILDALPAAAGSPMRLLGTADDQDAGTSFDDAHEVIDPRVRQPLASDADDDTAAFRSGDDYSPHFRRDQKYDDDLRDACAAVTDETHPAIANSQPVLEATGPAVAAMLAELRAAAGTVVDRDAILPTVAAAFDGVGLTLAAHVDVEMASPPPAWMLTEADDALDGESYLLRLEDGDSRLRAYDAGSAGLPSGLLLAELLELMTDPQAEDRPDRDESFARQRYPIATAMRLVLCFDDPDPNLPDPVPALIDLTGRHTLGGLDDRPLTHVLGETPVTPNYNIVVKDFFQDDDLIRIPWEVEAKQPGAAVDASRPANSFEATRELHRVVVIRRFRHHPERGEIRTEYDVGWVEGKRRGDGAVPMIRPPFQHEDRALDGVAEGEELEYRILALSPDRTLAEVILPVSRRRPDRVEAAARGQVLQLVASGRPSGYEVSFGFHLPVAGSPAVWSWEAGFVQFTPPPRPGEPSSRTVKMRPRVLYRPAALVADGPYGVIRSGGVVTRWVDGLPGRLTIDRPGNPDPLPAIRFAESDASRPTRGDTLTELAIDGLAGQWQPVFVEVPPDDGGLAPGGDVRTFFAARLRVPVDVVDAARAVAGADVLALEFFVALETVPEGGAKAVRSVPLRLRHALDADRPETVVAPADLLVRSDTQFFRRGTELDAVEFLPLPDAAAPAFVPRNHIVRAEPVWTPVDADRGLHRVELDVGWRHAPPVDAAGRFNPVVGYRVHRADLHLPADYLRIARAGTMPPNPQVLVDAVPLALYRDRPTTVVVRESRNWQQLVSVRPTANPDGRLGWVRVGDGSSANPVAPVSEAGPVYLAKGLADAAACLTTIARTRLDGVRLVVRQHAPLTAMSTATVLTPRPGETREQYADRLKPVVAARFATYRNSLDSKADPYGWRLAESLGLSCECRLLDANDNAVSLQGLLTDDAGRERPPAAFLDDLKVRIEAAFADGFPDLARQPFAVVFFAAEDRATLLNTIRLIDTGLGRVWDDSADPPRPKPVLYRLLRGTVVGEEPVGELAPTERLTDAYSDADLAADTLSAAAKVAVAGGALEAEFLTWVADGYERLAAASLDPRPQLTVFANVGTAEATAELPARSLPIKDGRLSVRLPVPDQWAHRYLVAVEVIRRYDRVVNPASGGDRPVPAEGVRPVDVIPRTYPLVPHNVLATPLPGGVRVFVFRHPADYASQATAANSVFSQHSGQTLLLRYRIDPQLPPALFGPPEPERATEPEVLGRIADWLTQPKLDGASAVDWVEYQRRLEESGEEVTAGHRRDPQTGAPEGPGDWKLSLLPGPRQYPFDPISNTEGTEFGADNFVYRDVPGYYQYAGVTYSTAGAVVSEPRQTGWVSPIYDGPPPRRPGEQPPDDTTFRLRPAAETCVSAELTRTASVWTLTVRLRMLPYRRPARPDVARLWVDADIFVPVPVERPVNAPEDEAPIRFGSLPDLSLGYRVYLKDPTVRGRTECLAPLVDLIPPTDKESLPLTPDVGDPHRWYRVSPILDRIVPVRTDGAPAEAARLVQAVAADGHATKTLMLEVTLRVENPDWVERFADIDRRIGADDRSESLVTQHLRVRTNRGGVQSIVVPPLT